MQEKYIWAPWRADYILGPKEKGCIFCNALKSKKDDKKLVLYRGEKAFVIMNKYPYNSGHVMVVPNRHTGTILKLKEDESLELMELIKLTTKVISKTLKPNSFNIGMNMGRGAGAGIPYHMHMHIVPRWSEDTNFMPVIGKTRVVSFGLDLIYDMLKKGFDAECRDVKSRPKRS
jgi:ATP adenylyltransferase